MDVRGPGGDHEDVRDGEQVGHVEQDDIEALLVIDGIGRHSGDVDGCGDGFSSWQDPAHGRGATASSA